MEDIEIFKLRYWGYWLPSSNLLSTYHLSTQGVVIDHFHPANIERGRLCLIDNCWMFNVYLKFILINMKYDFSSKNFQEYIQVNFRLSVILNVRLYYYSHWDWFIMLICTKGRSSLWYHILTIVEWNIAQGWRKTSKRGKIISRTDSFQSRQDPSCSNLQDIDMTTNDNLALKGHDQAVHMSHFTCQS